MHLNNNVQSPSVIKQMKRRLHTPGMLFVNIGADKSYFSLYAAALHANVIAFEPVQAYANLLNQGACLNRFSNITIFNAGLAGKEHKCNIDGFRMVCETSAIPCTYFLIVLQYSSSKHTYIYIYKTWLSWRTFSLIAYILRCA